MVCISDYWNLIGNLFILDLGPSSKVALIEQSSEHIICSYAPLWPTLGFALLVPTWVLCLESSVLSPLSLFLLPPPPLLPFAGCFFYLSLPGFLIFFFFPQITNTHIPISEKPCKNCKFCFVPDHVRSCVETRSSRYVIGLKRVQYGGTVVCSA
jgi:hypothetical protein